MKSILLLLTTILLFVSDVFAQTWNGTVSNVWTNPLNWTPNTVPGSSSIITLTSAGFSPRLQANTSIGGIVAGTACTLDVNGFSLSVGPVNNYNQFNSVTFINTNAGTDIVLNIINGGSGYYTYINSCTFNDKVTLNISGTDPFVEGNSGTNTFNDDVVFNVNSGLTASISSGGASQYNGNLNFTRTVAGTSNIFTASANVTGNVQIQNLAGGNMNIGAASANTNIGGMLSVNISNPTPSSFNFTRIKNQTTGGTINVQNSLAFNLQNDSLRVSSLTLQGYEGNAYAFLISNQIDGNVTIEDDINYSSGYYTEVRNNTITGNANFTIKGSNAFYEAFIIASQPDVVNGNTIFNIIGNSSVYLCHGAKSTFNGNLTINRTVGGYSRFFNAGATINGNLTFNNSSTGDNDLGSLANRTEISGTVNMNVNLVPIGRFEMYRIVNQTTGGKINIYNSRGFDLRQDSLKVDSLNVMAYRGNGYGYFIDNQINGNVTLSDSISYGGGYNTQVRNSAFAGETKFVMYGAAELYEGHTGANTFTGNLNIQVIGSGALYTSYSAKSTVTGNFTVNRTGAGYTRLFTNGANIGGNFTYTKNAGGGSDLGLLSNKTSIAGTININVTQTTINDFSMYRIQNLTNGGSILVNSTKGFDIQQDTLLTTSISILGYGGGAYGYLFDNQVTGNLSLQDIASYGGGYNTSLRNNTIIGNSIFTMLGTNDFLEASAGSSANTFNGNVLFNCDGLGHLFTSHASKSTFNGNLTINRTVAGNIRAFNAGATITGNFSCTKNVIGASEFGNLSNKTLISGTINMNITQSTASNFWLYRIQNLTNGGSITVNSPKGFEVERDTLLVSSLNIIGYGGGGYGTLYNNHITGNLNLQDIASYGGGWATYIRSNVINGNSIFTFLGSNSYYEADAGASANTFNGNVLFNCDGSGTLFTSHGSKSTFNGNLTINRTVTGNIRAFNAGATITGNFSCTKNALGASEFGNLSNQTLISGTINMNITQHTGSNFWLYRITNLTNGGSITVNSSKAFDVQRDSLLTTSFSILGYGGGDYGTLYNNHITGNLILQDDASYTNGYATYIRNNTILGNSSFTTFGNNVFNDGDAGNSGNTYLGNVTYNRNAGAMNIGTSDTNSYAGDLIFNNAAALPITAELIRFTGSNNTVIDQLGTGPVILQKPILNKTSNARVTLNKPVRVTSACTFVSGYINSNSTNPLIFLDNISHVGASDNSHVVGCVTKVGNDIFSFPVGNGIGYHPLAITAPATTTDSFQSCIILKHPSDDGYNVNAKVPALIQIAPFHYWTLNRISGTGPESVSVGWSQPCVNAGITNLPSLAVARWDGTQWANEGNSATTGTTTLGTVTQAGSSTLFGVYALATTTNLNAWSITVASSSATTICAGSPTTLTASGSGTYSWMPGGMTGASVVVSPVTTTTYTVTGTSATGCLTTATRTINVNPLPNTTTSATQSTICQGNSTTITASNANTYSWQPGGMTTAAITVSPAATTTYTVTGTTTATGCTKTATRTIIVNPLPNVTTSVSSSAICIGGSTTITAANANTYSWQPGGMTTAAITVSPVATTTYTVTGTTTATGCTKTATRTIIVNPLPTVGTTVTNSTICVGGSTTITGTGAVSYTWMPGSLSGTSINVTPSVTTTYTVTGTNANGCVNTATRVITVNPLPTVGTTVTNATICAGSSTTITGTGAVSYTWMPGSLSGTSINVTPSVTTTYTVTGTNANGCVNTSTRVITVNPLPTVATTVTNATICAGSSTTITGTGAVTYTWMPGSLSGTTVNVSPASTTTYTVTGTAANGCTKTATRLITVNAQPTVGTTVANATICAGSSTSITGTGALSYTWMPGSLSGATVNVSPASTTTYTVTGTAANGCTKTATRLITVNAQPTVGTTVTNATICAGSSTTITGTGAVSYTWMPGSLSGTSINVTPSVTTTYTVTGTAANGCTKTATRLITVNACSSTLNLKLFLEGYYDGFGQMNAVLFNQGVSSNTSLVDTITVRLRALASPHGIVATTKAVLNTNGNVTCTFTPSVSGTYYIEVLHRNSIKTWSSIGIAIGTSPATYDFSDLQTKAYGSNLAKLSTSPDIYGLFSGELNADENIDVLDLGILEIDVSNFLFGYEASDINGDGNVDILDNPILENNVNNFIYAVYP
jgi:hypothetical protein